MKTDLLYERERISTLKNYNILDTLSEIEYDDITKIASLVCNTPIALISLIDTNRQFFKSRQGLDITETPREHSFCAMAIQKPEEIMIVADSRKDVRFMNNPMVTGDPHVIFYAGVPLVNADGYALGSLCVIDNKPNNLNQQQIDVLKSLGRQVMNLLELRKKTRLLLESKKELKVLAKEMESFARVASHDLKEPLRMIKSFLKLFEDKYSKNLENNAKKYIDIALDGANRLDILITDLLEFSVAGKNINDIKEIDVGEIIEDVKKLLSLEIKEHQAIINYSELPKIKISETAIRQILQNLISNAIKYQNKDSKPIITITGRETNTHWEFSVRDNGIGIDKEYLESIFTIFKRLHRKEEFPGTGIGLAICKKIVGQYGGEIRVESEEGKGSTFYFNISKFVNT